MQTSLLRLAFAIHAALAGLFLSSASHADDEADKRISASHDTVERITITATKQKRPVSEVASSIDVLSSEQLDEQLAQDIGDLVRYLPGIGVNRDAGRFGLSDFAIRGLSGNRVLIEVDGVRVGDQFSIGSFSNAGRNLVDLDSVKTVELIRGSASSLYGSSAIGGVVSFITKDPADYVRDQGDVYSRVKTWYDGAASGSGLSLTGAMQQGPFGALAVINGAQSSETANGGDNESRTAARTAPNPQTRDSRSALVKFTWQPADDYLMRMSIDQREQNASTEAYWSRVISPMTNSATDDLDGDDTQERTRLQLDVEFAAVLPFIDAGLLQLYRQQNETRQETTELRHSLSSNVATLRYREFSFEQNNNGVELTLTSLFGRRAQHTLTYGFDWSRTETEELRNGHQTNLQTGVTTHIIMPDVFPVRDFPLSKTTESALYLQDEIVLGQSGVRLIPAVRYDSYKLDARRDAIFDGDNSNPDAVTDLEFHHTSPKLGLVLPLTNGHSLYAQYAEGFRAPPANDVNIGFENLMFGYTAIANPDLKPETSQNREIGWRFHSEYLSFDVAIFDNDYEDFIDPLAVVCAPPSCALLTYQAINRDEVRIKGVEGRASWDLASMFDVEGWHLKTAYSHARGEVTSDDQPLNSVSPDQWVLGIAYDGDAGGASVINTHYWKKDSDDVAAIATGVMPYVPEATDIVDVITYINIDDDARLNIAVFNAGDQEYLSWSNTQTIAEDHNFIDRYRAVGRYVSASLSIAF